MTSLRSKIAQMLVMGFAGTSITEDSPVAKWISEEHIGGVILFDYDMAAKKQGKNLVTQEQIKKLTSALNTFAKSREPLFIAIDYEGGAVDRLKYIDGCMPTLKPVDLAALSPSDLSHETLKMASTLKELGFNLNFAPVVDLNLNDKEGIIGKLGRTFSDNPKKVADIARSFVEAFAESGITSCYKHFPGHGSASGDTHEGFVDVSESFDNSEIEPYNYLLAHDDLPVMIMTAHVINKQLDDSGIPATLSKAILTTLLRQKLDYKGVIISDDLQMYAIAKHYELDEALLLTINAGADMLIFGNQFGDIAANQVIDVIEELVVKGLIDKKRIEEAYQRIRALKKLTMPILQD